MPRGESSTAPHRLRSVGPSRFSITSYLSASNAFATSMSIAPLCFAITCSQRVRRALGELALFVGSNVVSSSSACPSPEVRADEVAVLGPVDGPVLQAQLEERDLAGLGITD